MNRIKKTYSYINLTKRVNFLIKVLCEKNSVREASKLFNIKFSTGKAILKLFKQEGRIGKPNSMTDVKNPTIIRMIWPIKKTC